MGTSCTYDVSGTNEHRTAASNDDLNTLYANGNVITLNDVKGPELHTSLNAANDSATQAITAFSDYAATIDGATKVDSAIDFLSMIPQGSEENTDPDLDTDTWTKQSGWTHGSGEYTCDGTDDARIYKSAAGGSGIFGKYFIFEINISAYTSGSLQVRIGTGYYAVPVSGTGIVKRMIRAESESTMTIRSESFDGSITSISVKELEVLGSDLVTNGSFTLGADLNVSNCVNGNYTTFGGASPTAFNATSNGGGMHMAGTADEISFVSGQKYIVAFDEVLNSGTAPYVDIVGSIGGGSISVEGLQLSSVGSNVFEFTSNATTTGNLLFINAVTVTDFEITNLSVKDAGWDVSAASWSILGGLATYDDANDNHAMLQVDGQMLASIATEKVYRAVFTTDATPTTAALAIKNAAEDVVYLAQDDYTDDTHTRYFTTPADVSGAGIAFVAYQSGDAFDLDDVSLKEVTFP